MKTGITNAKGGGKSNTLLTTTTDATETSGVYTLALSYLADTPKVNDYIVFVDSGALTTLYQVSAVGSTEATLTKIGDVSGGGGGAGTPLYLHNLSLTPQGSAVGIYKFSIISNRSTPYDFASILQYLSDNDITNTAKGIVVSGSCYTTSNSKFWIPSTLYKLNSTTIRVYLQQNNSSNYSEEDYTNFTINTYTPISLGTASINNGGGKQLYLHNVQIYQKLISKLLYYL